MSHGNGHGSLFERLVPQPRPPLSLCRQEHAAQEVAAIKRHLHRLFNTRQGCSQSSPGMGLADFNGHANAAVLMNRIAADIRTTVEIYEPRLKVLNVQFLPDPGQPLALNFRLDCRLCTDVQTETVQIELVILHHHTDVK